MSLVFLRVWLLLAPVAAFYLPGVAPHEYLDNEKVEIKVNKLSSTKTQLPYDYYSLPFCRPAEVVNKMENLGEVLHGSVIKNSAYDISMGKIEFRVLCKRTLEPAEATLLHTRIRQDYRVHMIMDNLPAATKMIRELPDGQTIVMYDRGYPLGFVGSAERQGSVPGGAYLHNHLRFVLKYHKDAAFDGARIVGFEVEPLSVKHKYKGAWSDDASQLQLLTLPVGPDLPPLRVDPKGSAAEREVVYTYDVKWEPSDVKWASRWDLYLYMGDDQIHWFSIINSLAIVLLLTGIVAMIMMRTLRRDVSRHTRHTHTRAPRAEASVPHSRISRRLGTTRPRTRTTSPRSLAGSWCTPTSSGRRSSRSSSPPLSAPACSSSRWRSSPSAARCSGSSPPPTEAACSPPRCSLSC